MKFLLYLSFFLSIGWGTNNITSEKKLPPCPKSPNCVSTTEDPRGKIMQPLVYTNNIINARSTLKDVIAQNFKATLVEEHADYLHYEFKTKIGKYIDDVEFAFNKATKQIHFRSASRKGYSDMGANRRRMKKIRKKFQVKLLEDKEKKKD